MTLQSSLVQMILMGGHVRWWREHVTLGLNTSRHITSHHVAALDMT